MADLYYYITLNTLVIAASAALIGWIYFNFFDN